MTRIRSCALLAMATALPWFVEAGHAASSGAHRADSTGAMHEGILIAQIGLLLIVGRGLGEVMQRFGQPALIGQLLAGLILGPSLFGWIWPWAHEVIFPHDTGQKNLVAGVADVGVLMLLLLTGMEVDLRLVKKVGAPAVAVAASGVAVPFFCGFALGELLPDTILPNPGERLVAALFLGTALSISSIKIVAMVVREMNFMRRNLGQIILASAIMEDTAGWIIIAITLGIAADGGFAVGSLAKTIAGTAIFLVLSYTLGRTLVFRLIRWVNDNCASDYMVITAILFVMLVMALITQLIGVNAVLGAFVAGVLVGESPILSGQIEDNLRGLITALLMPVFFGLSGLSADLTIFRNPELALLTIGLIGIASVGKFSGAFVGAWFSGLSGRQAVALGCGMNARGSTEVIVATIGLSMGALTQDLYTMIVTMAVVTTMAMPPTLRWALARLPVEPDERARLEKERIDAKGFVSNFERLLIMSDESRNGVFAFHLANGLAGRRGYPMTLLTLKTKQLSGASAKPVAPEASAVNTAGRGAETGNGEKPSPAADMVEHIETENAAQAIATEAEKGFDLLFVGLEKMMAEKGGFSRDVNRIAGSFEGPMALVVAATGADALVPNNGFNILVPVNGTEISRRGAELAFALAPQEGTTITALYISERDGTRRPRHADARYRTEKAVRADVTRLGARYGFDISTVIRFDAAPEDAIFEEAERLNADFLVMGASRRIGDVLYLGKTATALAAKWQGNLILLAV